LATDIHASFQKIVRELKRLHEPENFKMSIETFSGWISDDSGGQIVLNQEIDKEIRIVADWLREQRPATKSQQTLKEWRNLVRNAFGPAFATLDLAAGDEENGKKLKKLVEEAIDTAPRTLSSLSMIMGCTLFQETLPAPLAIGPVLFETKPDWLARAEKATQITPKIRRRLERAFAGRRLAKAKDPWQDHSERAILDVLRTAQLVCTVETKDLAPAMAQERAIIGARLAQTALALFWKTPSYPLQGFQLSVDPGCRNIATLFFVPNAQHITGGGYLVGMPHGPSVKPQTLSKFLNDASDLLEVAGRMIECWTSTSAYGQAPPILRSLAQALFFFSEGCRDGNNLMAIVKFTAALEALAQGKAGKIQKLAKARLGIKNNAKFYGDKDIDEVVDWLYSKHRSRTLHGTNPEIHHDWSEARTLAEILTRLCLFTCIDWFKSHPNATEEGDFLS
jgi:hypothetical protein